MQIKVDIAANPGDAGLPIKLAGVENKVSQLEFDISDDSRVQMSEYQKKEYYLDGKTHTDRIHKLKTHFKQVYALILGQCMQLPV